MYAIRSYYVTLFEFHVSRSARQKYRFDEALFATDGRVVLADFAELNPLLPGGTGSLVGAAQWTRNNFV